MIARYNKKVNNKVKELRPKQNESKLITLKILGFMFMSLINEYNVASLKN